MEEKQYIDLVRTIINDSLVPSNNRTNVKTFSITGNIMKFNLSKDGKRILPLLTTKKMSIHNILLELLWFIAGHTNSKLLKEKGVNIWEKDSSRFELDKRGFPDRKEGDCGPIYGFQWRHFGAKYVDCNTDYTGQGVDQLSLAIEKVKSNPYSRQNIVSAWNPLDISKMVLPPCHVSFRLSVGNDDRLNCTLYQRSADVMLGLPYNIASYSLLVHMISYLVKLDAGILTIITDDTHIYQNHIENAKLQIERSMHDFPTLELINTENIKSIDDFKEDNFSVVNYVSEKPIKYELVV